MVTANRRRFLFLTATTGLAAAATPALAKAPPGGTLPPNEALMRQHGVIERLLLVYDAAVRHVDAGDAVALSTVRDAAVLVQRFVEEHHERLEEELVFPRFERAGRYVELVEILRNQHDAGRRLTAAVVHAVDERQAVEPMRAFVRMMRPHLARETTVLFPAFRRLEKPSELKRLARVFEDRMRADFGEDGYERTVAHVATLEERFGINDLRRFTPG